MKRLSFNLFIFLFLFFLSGCVTNQRAITQNFSQAWQQGNYNQAYLSVANIAAKNGGSDRLLYLLQAGAAQKANVQLQESIQTLDKAEEIINNYEKSLLNTSIESLSAVLLGESSNPYYGKTYDGIMLNTYKALDYLALGDSEDAVVEFNRSFERQERAAQLHASEIEKTRKAINQKKQMADRNNPAAVVDYDSVLNQVKDGNYLNWLNHWEAYPDFVNPATTYLHALVLYLYAFDASDLEKSSHLFKRALSMNQGKTKYILEDYRMVEKVLDLKMNRKDVEDMVWILIEDGSCAYKIERKYQVPIPMGRNLHDLEMVPIAIPEIREGRMAHRFYSTKVNDSLYQSEVIADIDRIIVTEFKKDMDGILLRAIVNTAFKALLQRQMTKEAGDFGKFVSMVYSQMTTNADTRMWSALPKDFQLIRVPRPSDGELELYGENGVDILCRIPLNLSGHSLVTVRIPSQNAKPSVTLIPDSN